MRLDGRRPDGDARSASQVNLGLGLVFFMKTNLGQSFPNWILPVKY